MGNTVMSMLIYYIGAIALVGFGWGMAFLVSKNKIRHAQTHVKEILAEAERKAERAKQKIILQAKEDWYKVRDE